jgi:hypothetical protein
MAAIEELRRQRAVIDRLTRNRDRAIAKRDRLIVQAIGEGEIKAETARAAGLSRQRVDQLTDIVVPAVDHEDGSRTPATNAAGQYLATPVSHNHDKIGLYPNCPACGTEGS